MDSEASDQSLMLEFQSSGNAECMTTLFRRHKDALMSFLVRLTGHADQAEELSQKAWLKVLDVAEKKRYRADANASFRTYLFTIARNLFFDERRRQSVREVHASTIALEASTGAAPLDLPDSVDSAALSDVLNAALLELPLEQREVLALWATGMRLADIATITGVGRDTVIGRKRYGIQRLRKAIKQSGNTP